MKKMIFVLVALFTLISCKTRTQIEVVEKIKTDSIYIVKLEKDSVYMKDSIFIERRNDTVFKNKVQWMYRYQLIHDTLRVASHDTIPVVKEVEVVKNVSYVPWYAKLLSGCGIIGLIILALWVGKHFL